MCSWWVDWLGHGRPCFLLETCLLGGPRGGFRGSGPSVLGASWAPWGVWGGALADGQKKNLSNLWKIKDFPARPGGLPGRSWGLNNNDKGQAGPETCRSKKAAVPAAPREECYSIPPWLRLPLQSAEADIAAHGAGRSASKWGRSKPSTVPGRRVRLTRRS